tara:strand:+ start:8082 stop:8570 length:489 start_codon:yes stop_codon:yes gene_type:complete
VDILTEKGQVSLNDEQTLAKWLEKNFSLKYIQTPKDTPALVDAIVTNKNSSELLGVAETKCRYDIASLEQFQTNYKNEWLVTWSKVNNAINIATSMGVPCVGFLYLVKPRVLLTQKLSDNTGRLAVDVRLSTTSTQATINGGIALRTNAFINMAGAKIYTMK